MTLRFLPLPSSLAIALGCLAATAEAVADPNPPAGNPIVLDRVVVSDHLDRAREDIVPDLGATSFLFDAQQLQNLPRGANAGFNEILLRAPGVAEDSAANGDLHVRGEHGNLQYRINNVLLPEGITGFGLELDPRFVSRVQLITGSLPAQYGFRTAGVVEIKTKSGAFDSGGETGLFAGSDATLRPSFEASGTSGRVSYFADASYDHDTIGIENPTRSASPIHDHTDQGKAFAYISRLLTDTSRVSAIASVSTSRFQVPDTPGLAAGTSPDGSPWLPGSFDSAKLDENQREQNAYGVVALQKSAGAWNGQASVFGRSSAVHFVPDPVGDLYFNGVASDVDRRLSSAGLQADGSYALSGPHTLRAGAFLLAESVTADTATRVFPVNAGGDPTGAPFTIADATKLHGGFGGVYAQDEWRLGSRVTVNFGARFDVFRSGFDDEDQLSPRLNLIYQPTATTTLHGGYARYFTPPPVENVSAGTVREFAGTSNAAPSNRDDPVRAERADYFDAGISQKLGAGWQLGLDGYAKQARNQLDDGLFGQTLILSAFNYARGEVHGLEFSTSYSRGGFSAFANLADSIAKGRDWTSAQFLFDPADLAYVQQHWIYLDHDQQITGSAGAAYLWRHSGGSTRFYGDTLYGTGLRTDATAPDGSNIPNGGNVPAHLIFDLGVEESFALAGGHALKLRFDAVNLTDKIYELRDGSGVGVNAAQYGRRRGFFGTASYSF